jgi:inorganic pyrophosphatase
MSIWDHFDGLVVNGSVIIDRPRGVSHPKVAEYVYPLDYGYIDGTDGGDGSGIDIWIGSSEGLGATALLCTFDPLKLNAEVKVVWNCDEREIEMIDQFYAAQPQAVFVVLRQPDHDSGGGSN